MNPLDEIYAKLVQAIDDGDMEAGVAAAKLAIEAGVTPTQLFDDVITPTLKRIGDRFSRLEIFLPEMMMSADVVKAVFSYLEPIIQASASKMSVPGTVVIGTVAGDTHDIGKNMVARMLEVNGFKVYDLGTDVPVKAFLDKAREVKADIIAMSSLLTTSLPYMKDLLAVVKETREPFKIMVGGGPVTPEWAAQVGADGYGKDASEAVAVALKLVD